MYMLHRFYVVDAIIVLISTFMCVKTFYYNLLFIPFDQYFYKCFIVDCVISFQCDTSQEIENVHPCIVLRAKLSSNQHNRVVLSNQRRG